jgi:hypothetical protein
VVIFQIENRRPKRDPGSNNRRAERVPLAEILAFRKQEIGAGMATLKVPAIYPTTDREHIEGGR